MLSQQLMEKALALTGKTTEDMKELIDLWNNDAGYCFSIEKFCYYLLSPEFIENLIAKLELSHPEERKSFLAWDIGNTIHEYQLWNKEPLVELLSKI